MPTFSTNQVKHLYVAKAVDANLDTVGDIKFAAAGDKDIVFKYVGNDGVVRSDIINLDNIIYAKAIKESTMEQYLESAYVACNTVAANQPYILKVIVDSFSSLAEEDKGFIFAEYTAKSTDAAKNILAGLAVSLAKNATKAAYNPLIKVFLTTAASGSVAAANLTEVTASTDIASLTGTYLGLVIEAADQAWSLGKEGFNLLKFNVTTSEIIASGVSTQWATVTKGADHPTAALKNSKKIADLEWFCMGERGDMYRDISWPNSFTFTPQVNPAAAYGYHVIEIAFYYAGDAEDVQKSPKEIVIPCEAAASGYTLVNAVISDLNTAAGTTLIATLS